jgi:hypothetical protein
MITTLVRRRIEAAGLMPLVTDRGRAIATLGPEARRLVDHADPIALGAAADLVRRKGCGTLVRVCLPSVAESAVFTIVGSESLLRRVATLRLLGPDAVRIAVDCDRVGVKLALVALSFGASDLTGSIPAGRRREIEREIERLGFEPAPAGAPLPPRLGETTAAAEGA